MNKLILKVSRFSAYVYYMSRFAKLWYLVYQFVWERKTRDPLFRFPTFQKLVDYVRDNVKWRRDGPRELGDAMSHPEAVQWRISAGLKAGDCEDISEYHVAVINNEIRHCPHWGVLYFDEHILRADNLIVMWRSPAGWAGHSVDLITLNSRMYSYMDYGRPSTKINSIDEVAQRVMRSFVRDGELIAWVVIDEKFNPVAFG